MRRSLVAALVIVLAYGFLLACRSEPSPSTVIRGGATEVPAVPTTAPPATTAPATASPTRPVPTSPAPTTAAPTTAAPTTAAPTTAAPTVAAVPTVAAPTAAAPTPTVAVPTPAVSTATPTLAPTPSPTPQPTPTVVLIPRPAVPASGLVIHGRVTNAAGMGVGNACITLGPPIRCWTRTSSGAPADTGYYVINLSDVAATPGTSWDIYVVQTTCAQYYSGKFVVSGLVQHDAALAGSC